MRRVSVLIVVLCTLVLTPVAALAVNHDGDITVDGVVNTVDLLWALQAVLGSRKLTTEQEQHGDVAPLVAGASQPDGVFNLGDVVVITRLVLGGLVFSVPAPPPTSSTSGTPSARARPPTARSVRRITKTSGRPAMPAATA